MAPRHSSENGSSVPLGDSSATSEIVEQARGRSDGFDMGDDRAIVSTPNWNNQTSVDLYKAATTNNEPGTVAATGHAWAGHGDELSQVSNELYTAISELGNVWIGQGAGAAQGALVGIANSSSQASEAAQAMAKRLAQQATAAEEVKKMPAPKDYDPATGMTAALAEGPAALIADQKVLADAAADVKAQQVAFFNAYTKAMSDIDGSTPSFGPESLGMKPIAGGGGPAGFNRVGTIGGSQGVGDVGQGGPTTVYGQGSDSVYNGSGYAGAGLGPDSGQFTQAGYNPAASHQGAVPGGGSVAPGAGAAPGVGSGVGAGAVPPAPPAPPSGGGGIGQAALGLGALGAAGLGIAGARTLGQGNRSGGKSDDSTAAAANEGSGQSAASVGGPQQGLVSAGGTIGGSPTPPPPMSGMGGTGGAGAQQQDDEEHTHASFLIDPDPDETFGANEATPPPVIGAWSEDER